MKKIILLLTILSSSILCNFASTRNYDINLERLVINYEFDELTFENGLRSDNEKIPHLNDFQNLYAEGAPCLPMSSEIFELPKGLKIKNLEIEAEIDTISVKIAPSLPLTSDNCETLNTDNIPDILPYSGYWPLNFATISNLGIYRDRILESIRISPVLYNYNDENIIFSRKLKVYVEFEPEEQIQLFSESQYVPEETHSISHDFYKSLLTIPIYDGSDEIKQFSMRRLLL